MELKNVLTFLRAAELESFTKAANELGYSQSTVTIQIKQLEGELGVPLFDRIGKKVSLTPIGQEFVGYANVIMRATSEVKAMGKEPHAHYGTLRLGILESLLVWKFSDLIPQFNHALPFINIEVKSASGPKLYRMLRQNDLDVIFLLDKKTTPKDCVRASANPEDIVFVTSPDNPLARQKNLPLREVLKQPLILTERDALYRQVLDETAAQQDIDYAPILEVDNLTVLRKLLKRGMGTSFLPLYSVRESVANGELALLDVQDCHICLWSQVIYHKNKWVTPQMELFIRLIEGT